MKKAEFTLTLKVVYEREDGGEIGEQDMSTIRSNLDNIPRHAAGVGAITANLNGVVVDVWEHAVEGPKESA